MNNSGVAGHIPTIVSHYKQRRGELREPNKFRHDSVMGTDSDYPPPPRQWQAFQLHPFRWDGSHQNDRLSRQLSVSAVTLTDQQGHTHGPARDRQGRTVVIQPPRPVAGRGRHL